MRNLKKLLALVLAMMMTLSLMITVNAATTNKKFGDVDKAEPTFAEDIQVLTGMDIIQGLPGGDFGYLNQINRHQMATFIYRITTGDVEGAQVDYWATYNTFKDVNVNDSYAGYIGYCQYAGYIQGYPDGTFKPMAKLTGYQALAMILRAIGYNEEGHNFKGNDWLMQISNTTTTNELLAKVRNTVYKERLYQPATRELVAELVFQGILQPQVRWTAAFGYQKYGMEGGVVSSILNPSLGQAVFGLTRNTGIIVGNEATGEGDDVTKIGFSLTTTPVNSLGNLTIDTTANTVVTGLVEQTGIVTAIDDSLKINTADNASGYVYANDTADVPHNVTRAFKWESKLKDFGHKVDVWYDCRSDKTVEVGNGTKSAKFTTDLTTYAVFDRYNEKATRVVTADDADMQAASVAADSTTTLGEALGYTGNVYWNYAFGPNVAANYGDDGNSCNSLDFESPIMENNSSTPYQLYLAISNNAEGAIDMVVSLDLTITQISQQNDTKAPLTVGVNNGTANKYFDIAAAQVTGAGEYTNILQSSLVDNSDKTLWDNVAAILITGTNPGNPAGTLNNGIDGTATNNNGNYTNAGSGIYAGLNSSTYYHQLTKLTKTERHTVVQVDTATNEVTYRDSDGTIGTLKQSVLAGAVANNRNLKYTATENVNFTKALMGPATVTFTLDGKGDYIYWEPDTGTSEFVYATYLDYTTQLNTSSYTYSITVVDENGNSKVVKTPVRTYNTWNGTTVGPRVAFTDIDGYTDNIMPKRDATVLSGTVEPGQYVGYIIDAAGNLTAVTPAGTTGSTSGTAANPMVQASTADFDVASGVTIGARDVIVGAKEIQNSLFLTNNTIIYLVGGAGTDNQTLKTFKGIDELLDGWDSVIIHSDEDTTSAYNTAAVAFPFDATTAVDYADMIYFKQSPFTYAQNYADSAQQVDVVYIPVECVEFVPAVDGNVFFVGNNVSTLADAARNTTQFTMYDQAGNAHSIWITGLDNNNAGDGVNSADKIIDNGKNVFYKLLDTGSKAWDDTPIYTLMAYNGAGVIGQYWNEGTDSVGTPSVTTNPTTAPARYMATTYETQAAFIDNATNVAAKTGTLYNVGDAKVVNLDKVTYPGIIDGNRATLDAAGSIYNNESVPVSCVLGSSNAVIAVIFVNA